MAPCDFCESSKVGFVYRPVGTIRDASVMLCQDCGLLQTRYGPHERDRTPRMSGDADWGNVRWCKSFRMDAVEGILHRTFGSRKSFSVLDVGSNRGDFLRWVSDKYPEARIVGVEPDERLAGSYSEKIRQNIIFSRFEECALEENSFDFVYCVQTLEHAHSAADMLSRIWNCLRVGGIAFIEVPNINVLDYKYSVEEFFIDKHSFHFHEKTLKPFVESLGFRIVHSNEMNDPYNVALLLEKIAEVPGARRGGLVQPAYANEVLSSVDGYAERLKANRASLPAVVANISSLNDRMNVCFWGATTIFDLLVRYGGLNPQSVRLLVDTYLHRFAESTHGVPIQEPGAIRGASPDVCVVLARFSSPVIVEQARHMGVRNVVTFEQLLIASQA